MIKRHTYVQNTTWLLSEKIIRIIASFAVSIWVANYLGVVDFGLLNYALSFALLFSSLLTLGLDKYIPKQLILGEEEDRVLANTLHMRLFGSLVMVLVVNTISCIVKSDDNTFKFIVVIVSLGYTLKSFDVLRFWFEAKVISIYSIAAQTIALLCSVVLKCVLIFIKAPVEYFAFAIIIEYIIQAFILSYLFLKFKNIKMFYKISIKEIRVMFITIWPLLLASFLYDIYSKIDVLMLGKMFSNESVGLYAAATKISLGWIFIPVAIATSFFPSILNEKRKKGVNNYNEYIQILLNFLVFLSLCIAILISIFSNQIINILYSSEYEMSAIILIIHIWGTVFITMGTIVNRVLIAENLNVYLLYRALIGFFTNLILNMFLIPTYGAVGASIATVISLLVSLFLFNAVNKETQHLFRMQVKALNPVSFLLAIKNLKNIK